MKRGQEAEGIVRRVDFPNKGQVELTESEESVGQGAKPSRMVTVKHVLPGQKIRLRLKKAGRSKSQGILLEVLKKAPNELEQAACPHFAECGGCSYQNLPYEDQRKLKEDQIRHLMQPLFGEGVDRIFEGGTASPARQEYRNKMEYCHRRQVPYHQPGYAGSSTFDSGFLYREETGFLPQDTP